MSASVCQCAAVNYLLPTRTGRTDGRTNSHLLIRRALPLVALCSLLAMSAATLPSWARHLETALAAGGPAVRFLSLATVEGGEPPQPRVRTVAFRGWHGSSGAFFVVTDSRHQKVSGVGGGVGGLGWSDWLSTTFDRQEKGGDR